MKRCSSLLSVLASLSLLVYAGCSSQESAEPAVEETVTQAPPDSTVALRQRIAWLEAQRSFGGDTLFEATRHPDVRVRHAAVVALGRIQDAAAVDALLACIEDENPFVVRQTAWALRQLQGLDEDAGHRVQSAMTQQLDLAAIRDAWMYLDVLSRQGGAASTLISGNYMASGLLAGSGSSGRPPRVEGMAAAAMAHVNDATTKRIMSRLGDLNNRVGEATWRIAWAFSSAPDSSYYASALSLMQHPEPYARAAGARALEDIGIKEARETLVQSLADFDWEVRAAVLRALGDLGDEETVGFCISMLDDRHPLVREAACRALLQLGAAKHIDQLEEITEDAVPAVRLLACQLLAQEGSQEQGLAVWGRARSDAVDWVRSDALQFAIDALGEEAGIDSLLHLLEHGNVRERTQAAGALGDLEEVPSARAAGIRSGLEQRVGDVDHVVATVAVDALGNLGMHASLPLLSETWESLPRTHENNDILLGIAGTAASFAENQRGDAATLRTLLQQCTEATDPRIVHQGRVGLAHLSGDSPPEAAAPKASPTPSGDPGDTPIDLGVVRVRLTTRAGTATIELDGNNYPRTVSTFLRNIDAGLHDDGVFHRVVPSFVVQGGCPRGDGWGDPGYSIPCEYGDLRYDQEGIVGMAHAGKDTGGSQFFISHLPIPRLDGRYTAFGRVVDGMDVIDKIVRGDRFKLERIAAPAGSSE